MADTGGMRVGGRSPQRKEVQFFSFFSKKHWYKIKKNQFRIRPYLQKEFKFNTIILSQ